MNKRRHEAPSDDQLRIGEYPLDLNQVDEDKTFGLPPHLQLTDRERLRFENAVDVLGRDRAIIQAVSKTKGEQIIGHWASHNIDAKLGDQLEDSRTEQQASIGPSTSELAELLRDVHRAEPSGRPPEPTDKAA